MTDLSAFQPLTNDNVEALYAYVFAPWVRGQGLRDFKVSEGRASAILPYDAEQAFFSGAICGQALMSAIDTVAAIAMFTTDRVAKGTAYQHTQFLRAAKADAFLIETDVLRFGQGSAYAETSVKDAQTGRLIARASSEFAF